MSLLLSRENYDAKPKKISEKDILTMLKEGKEEGVFLSFDFSNKDKDIKDLKAKLEDKGHSVFIRDLRFGLKDSDVTYEFHIMQ